MRRGVETHLRNCATCAAEAERLRQVAEAVGAVPRASAPAGLRARIVSAVAAAARVVEPACAECAEMASAYIDGELEGADRDAFEAHVFACSECFAMLKGLERPAELLRATPRRAAPADLYERITAAVAAEHEAAARFTWRRALSVAAGLAAAAAITAALLLPGDHAPNPSVMPPPVVAQTPTQTPGTGPAAAAAPTSEAPEVAETAVAVAPVVEPAAPRGRPVSARTPRSAENTRPVRAASRVAPAARSPEETHLVEAPPVAESAPSVVDDEPGQPVLTPMPPASTTVEPRPAPEPVASPPVLAEASPAPEPAAPAAEPAPVLPVEPTVALAPRTSGPQPRSEGSVTTPVSPAPEPVSTAGSRSDEPVRIAVVPRRQGARTLYRASGGLAHDTIERAREAVNRGQSLGFDDPRTGIELR